MRTIKRILVPVDGSVTSDRAVDTAVMLAESSGAVLDLLYVSYFPPDTDDMVDQVSWLPDSVTGSSTKTATAILSHAQQRIPASIQAETHCVTGIPAKKIVEFSNQNDQEMIVVGGRGLGLVEGFLLGSVSQEVMESSKGPVIIVK